MIQVALTGDGDHGLRLGAVRVVAGDRYGDGVGEVVHGQIACAAMPRPIWANGMSSSMSPNPPPPCVAGCGRCAGCWRGGLWPLPWPPSDLPPNICIWSARTSVL